MGHLHGVAGPTPTILSRAGWAGALALLFVVVYGSCNTLTAHRHDVGTLYFEWERHIPVVPLLIVPYMSLDLFFVAAPFVCATRRELRTLAARIALGIAIAGVGFLLLPLRYGFERPQVEGWLGSVFTLLHGFDQPYNLLPSLHIILRTVLAYTVARKARGPWRLAVHVWFVLIGLSTVLVGQHHVLDVIAGFAVGVLLFFLVRDDREDVLRTRNPRIAVFYGAGVAALAAVTTLGWPWSAPLLWPIVALVIVGLGYLGLGARITAKRDGRLPFSAKVVLGPWLVGQHLSWRHYARRCEAWNEITPKVLIGRRLDDVEARAAIDRGVTAVLDLTAAFDEAAPFLALPYLNVQVLDLTAPPRAALEHALDFVDRESARGVVYVHCKVGYSRSAAVGAAWLLRSRRAGSVEEAARRLRGARPSIVIRPEIRVLLDAFARTMPPSEPRAARERRLAPATAAWAATARPGGPAA